MPLTSVARPGTLEEDRGGVLFPMDSGTFTVRVFVSRHALEDIDQTGQVEAQIERFDEYRTQFEQIASDKYDKGFVEGNGIVYIRGRDLPGRGY